MPGRQDDDGVPTRVVSGLKARERDRPVIRKCRSEVRAGVLKEAASLDGRAEQQDHGVHPAVTLFQEHATDEPLAILGSGFCFDRSSPLISAHHHVPGSRVTFAWHRDLRGPAE